MAKVKFGMMMTDARGKLGGQVFTKARQGATVRTKVTPTNPRTSAQSGVRANFSQLSSGWSLLTEDQRTAWNSAVNSYPKTNIFGDSYLTTGKSLYIGVNSNIINAGGTIISEPPVLVVMPNPINITGQIVVSHGFFTITPDDEITGANIVYYFSATAPSSPGIYNFTGAYRYFYSCSLAANDPVDNYDNYVLKFGVPAAGKKVSLQTKLINKVTGQVSQVYIDTELVLA